MTRQDHSFDNPTIEVLSTSPRLEMLQVRLRQVGMRPVRAATTPGPGHCEPLLLDIATIGTGIDLTALAREWAAHASARLLIVLGEVPVALKALPVLRLRDVDQISTLTARIAIRQRETRRQRENTLRMRTARQMGVEPATPLNQPAPRILYLGEGSPRFAPLRSALRRKQIETVAALSRITALDYLSTGRFDAVVLHPQHGEDEATKFLARFNPADGRANLKLLLIEEPDFIKDLPGKHAAKATALLSAAVTPEALAADIADQLTQPANALAPSTRLSSPVHDGATKLFSRAFLEAHLEAQFAESNGIAESISLIALTISRDGAETKRITDIVARHMRDTDMAANLDARHICITLPATPYRGAVSLARRIEAAAGTDLQWRAIERRQFHTVKTLLSALTAKPGLRALKRA